MHERRDNVLGTDVLGNFRLALECANLNFPTLETFEMALMRSFKLLLTLFLGPLDYRANVQLRPDLQTGSPDSAVLLDLLAESSTNTVVLGTPTVCHHQQR